MCSKLGGVHRYICPWTFMSVPQEISGINGNGDWNEETHERNFEVFFELWPWKTEGVCMFIICLLWIWSVSLLCVSVMLDNVKVVQEVVVCWCTYHNSFLFMNLEFLLVMVMNWISYTVAELQWWSLFETVARDSMFNS